MRYISTRGDAPILNFQDVLLSGLARDETFVAKAVVEARFLSTSGERITSAQILALTDYQGPSPAMPDWIADWQRAQPAMSDPKFKEE